MELKSRDIQMLHLALERLIEDLRFEKATTNITHNQGKMLDKYLHCCRTLYAEIEEELIKNKIPIIEVENVFSMPEDNGTGGFNSLF